MGLVEQHNNHEDILKRHDKNPILVPNEHSWWESRAVFNCATLYDGDKVHMLYRAVGDYENYISRLGYASSTDGYTFTSFNEMVFGPTEDYERFGIEDPRLVLIDSQIYITYVVLSDHAREGPSVSSALATTQDYHEFERLGIITSKGSDNKDVVIFPEKMMARVSRDVPLNKESRSPCYFSLQRPSTWIGSSFGTNQPSIWLGESSSKLTNFDKYVILLEPKEDWEALKIGAGSPPIKTRQGWLIIYHGVSRNKVYRAGAALLDLNDPTKILGRTKRPILEPKETYERYGDVDNVVFPSGACVIDGTLFVYYGAADRVCCLATAELDTVLEQVLQNG
jgi:beta-1,2-mannobiose phosphorylase / 1,2-beta-oligomannan phosphorylase